MISVRAPDDAVIRAAKFAAIVVLPSLASEDTIPITLAPSTRGPVSISALMLRSDSVKREYGASSMNSSIGCDLVLPQKLPATRFGRTIGKMTQALLVICSTFLGVRNTSAAHSRAMAAPAPIRRPKMRPQI